MTPMIAGLIAIMTLSIGAQVAYADTKTGVGSWYGDAGEIPPGYVTSCGEIFDRMAMAAAVEVSIPCGTRVKVTDVDTGKTVEVTINDHLHNDRGINRNRIVDLTYGAARRLGVIEKGLFKAKIETLD